MGGANGQPRLAAVDQIEIDQFLKGLLQRRGRVVAGALGSKYSGQVGPTPSQYWKNFQT